MYKSKKRAACKEVRVCLCCVQYCTTHRRKFEVLLVDEVEDVLDPVPVIWTRQLHWRCQGAHSCYYGLLQTQRWKLFSNNTEKQTYCLFIGMSSSISPQVRDIVHFN